jgi:hypothetical protein
MTQPEQYYKGSSNAVVISDAHTHTHAKNITHTQHSIHDVLNVNNLNLFEPPLLYEVVTIIHQMDNIQIFHPPFLVDRILHSMTRRTSQQQYILYCNVPV